MKDRQTMVKLPADGCRLTAVGRRLPAVGCLLAILACSPGTEKIAPANESTVRTPGMCGWWETADSTALAACQTAALRSIPPRRDSLFPGECGFYQTLGLDSLRACLQRMDRLAAACPVVASWRMRLPEAGLHQAEWRRCGPPAPTYVADSTVWPGHHLLIRADTLATSPAIFSYSNAEEEGLSGLEAVQALDLDGDGTDELFFIDQIYGTGAMFDSCALTVSAGRFRCWSGPNFKLSGALRPGEQMVKGPIPMPGPPDRPQPAGPLVMATGQGLWYFAPISAEGDANCCSSVNAAVWFEARPSHGRFENGLLLRVQEDSIGNTVAIDTLER